MRQRLFGVGFVIVLAGANAGAQQSSSSLEALTTLRPPSTLPTCGIGTALGRLAGTSRVTYGFEEATECRGQVPAVDPSYADTGSRPMTVREFLDQLVALSPNYRWSEMNGVAVVRPAESWADAANPLNTRIDPFRLDNATVSDALALMLHVPREHGTLSNHIFSMTFNDGTMLDALNALVQARQGVAWHTHTFIGPTSAFGENRWLMISIQAFSSGDSTEGKRTSGLEQRMIRFDHFPVSR